MNEYTSILEKIRLILGMENIKKFNSSELENGVTIYYDGELSIDTNVFTDESLETAVEDGEYVLTSGDKIVVSGGKVTEITPVEEQSNDKSDFEDKYNEIKGLVDSLNEKLNSFEKNNMDLKETIEKLESDIKEYQDNEIKLKSDIEKLENEPSATSVTDKKLDVVELTDVEKRLKSLESIRKLKK